MAWRRLLRGITMLSVLTAASRELRAEERARLVYVREAGAERCPAEVDLRLRVVARLGYDPFSPQASRVVLARISAGERALEGSVELVDSHGISSGKRALSTRPESCEELSRAMALSISLTIDPDSERAADVVSPPRAVSAPVASPPPQAQPLPADEAPGAPSPPARDRRHFFAGAAVAGATGALPAPALGAFGFLGFRGQRLAWALEGRAVQSFASQLSPRGSLHGSLIGPGLSGCWLWSDFGVCLVTLAAAQRLVSSDVSDARASSGLFAAVGPRLTWRTALGRQGFALALSLEALLNLSPNTARFADTTVWKAPILSGHAQLGIETPFL